MHLSKAIEPYNTKNESQHELWPVVNNNGSTQAHQMEQLYHTSARLYRGIIGEMGCRGGQKTRGGVEYIELCVLSAQLFCTSKTMPKIKFTIIFLRSL